MASNEVTYGLKLAWRALTGVAMLKGRSRRAELLYYLLAALLLSWLLGWLTELLFPQVVDRPSWQARQVAEEVVKLVVFLPFFALFARRMHDQDRTGWWALALALFVAMSSYDRFRFILIDSQTGVRALHDLPWWGRLASIACWLTVVAFLFRSGTAGPNRFGPDPRDEDPRAARLPSADSNLSSAS